jgi:hypothetical protein
MEWVEFELHVHMGPPSGTLQEARRYLGTDSPWFMMVPFNGGSAYHKCSVETASSDSKVWIFPRLTIYSLIVCAFAGQWQWVMTPSHPQHYQGRHSFLVYFIANICQILCFVFLHPITSGKGPSVSPVPIQTFWFSFSVQYSVNDLRCSSLRYKIGFALEELAQLWADVNVLSTFKVGKIKLWCSVGYVQ